MVKTAAKSARTTPSDASRVQSRVAKSNGGIVPKGSYAARLQGAAARNSGKSGGK
jgi:hypothetical protein